MLSDTSTITTKHARYLQSAQTAPLQRPRHTEWHASAHATESPWGHPFAVQPFNEAPGRLPPPQLLPYKGHGMDTEKHRQDEGRTIGLPENPQDIPATSSTPPPPCLSLRTLPRPQTKWEIYTFVRMYFENADFWGPRCSLVHVGCVLVDDAAQPVPPLIGTLSSFGPTWRILVCVHFLMMDLAVKTYCFPPLFLQQNKKWHSVYPKI